MTQAQQPAQRPGSRDEVQRTLMGHRTAPPAPIPPQGRDGSGTVRYLSGTIGDLLDGLILLASVATALAGVFAWYLVWLYETPWWGFFLALAMLGQVGIVPALLSVSRRRS